MTSPGYEARILGQVEDGFWAIDGERNVTYLNAAAKRFSGIRRGEALGRPLLSIEPFRSWTQDERDSVLAAVQSGGLWRGHASAVRRDGQHLDVSVTIGPFSGVGDQIGRLVVIRDATGVDRPEGDLGPRPIERVRVAHTLARLHRVDTIEATATLIATETLSMLRLAIADIVVFQADGSAFPVAAITADGRQRERRRLPMWRSSQLRARARDGPWVAAWEPRRDDPYRVDFADLGIRATAYVPLCHGDRAFGLLVAGAASVHAVEELSSHLPMLAELGTAAAILLGPYTAPVPFPAEIDARVRKVLAERSFWPVFQPIVHLRTGAVVGFEALTRFADGRPPTIQFAEASSVGLLLELEAATLAASMTEARALPPGAWLNVNVSPQLVRAGDPLRVLVAAWDGPIVLEITEHEAIDDYDVILGVIRELGPHVRLAVDDAGAGYASFRHILELHPAYIKLDRSLVSGIERDPARQALVAGMRFFALKVGCVLIAEGIETEPERRTLLGLAVDLGQGYAFGRPMPRTQALPNPSE